MTECLEDDHRRHCRQRALARQAVRSEWGERNRAYDQQATEFTRRLDELRQDFGAVYGTRDVIQDMKRD
ncbi:hypothetical protein [Mesorhizobium shangrilense]|uniref:Uncharacterized protein n=1 Tax=Mesorhizobium shangrilense TaxID=460060 RepID=A0ABV2D739_9HYPH